MLKGVAETNLRHVTVVLLNGIKLDVLCSLKTISIELFDYVCAQLNLSDHLLFGTAFLQGAVVMVVVALVIVVVLVKVIAITVCHFL